MRILNLLQFSDIDKLLCASAIPILALYPRSVSREEINELALALEEEYSEAYNEGGRTFAIWVGMKSIGALLIDAGLAYAVKRTNREIITERPEDRELTGLKKLQITLELLRMIVLRSTELSPVLHSPLR